MLKNKRDAARVLAKTIDQRSVEVKDALFDSGVNISPNADKEELVDAVIENLGGNRRLQRKIGSIALSVDPSAFGTPKFRKQSGDDKFFQTRQGQQVIETTGEIAGVALANFLAGRLSSCSLTSSTLDDGAAEGKESCDKNVVYEGVSHETEVGSEPADDLLNKSERVEDRMKRYYYTYLSLPFHRIAQAIWLQTCILTTTVLNHFFI